MYQTCEIQLKLLEKLLRGKFHRLKYIHLKKKIVNDLSIHLKKLEKEQQIQKKKNRKMN